MFLFQFQSSTTHLFSGSSRNTRLTHMDAVRSYVPCTDPEIIATHIVDIDRELLFFFHSTVHQRKSHLGPGTKTRGTSLTETLTVLYLVSSVSKSTFKWMMH